MGAVALGLALVGVPLERVGDALADAAVGPTALVAGCFVAGMGLRALRQRELSGGHGRLRAHLSVVCVGFLAIVTVPARLGELVRPVLLRERAGLTLGHGLAVVLLERVLDLCAALVLVAVGAGAVRLADHGVSAAVVELARTAWLALPMVALGLLLLPLAGPRVLATLAPLERRRPGSVLARLGQALRGLLRTALEGVVGLSPVRWATAVGLTAVIWLTNAAMVVAAAWAVGVQDLVGLREAAGVMGLTLFGGALPAPPGQLGTLDAVLRWGLALYGVSGDAAGPGEGTAALGAAGVAAAVLLHWWPMLFQVLLGAGFLVRDGLSLSTLRADVRALRRQVAAGTS